jgi:uncharacterized protein (TIGR03083 family)
MESSAGPELKFSMQGNRMALGPIFVVDLFPKLDSRLIELLRSLSPADWERQTIAPLWRVKDVVAHLLDTNLRRLSILRDGFFGEKPDNPNSWEGMVAFLNRLNADWVKAFKRVSPPVLVDLLEHTGKQVNQMYRTLDPFAEAVLPVAWAGEERSLNWFEMAREYTERWHHQQQIRVAVERPGIMERELYLPVIDTFMRALPFGYRSVEAKEGTVIEFSMHGDAGDVWFLVRHGGKWELASGHGGQPASKVEFSQQIAWRMFTKGISKDAARAQITVSGDRELGLHILNVIAVMA